MRIATAILFLLFEQLGRPSYNRIATREMTCTLLPPLLLSSQRRKERGQTYCYKRKEVVFVYGTDG